MPDEGVWAHYAAVVDAISVSLYVAGTFASSEPITGPITARTVPFTVARASNESAYFFKGELDELAVYPRALSVAEVAAHAALGR